MQLGNTIRIGSTGIHLIWNGSSDSDCTLNFQNDDTAIVYNVYLDNQQGKSIYTNFATPGQTLYCAVAFGTGQQYVAIANRH
jgi:hypothetical protein